MKKLILTLTLSLAIVSLSFSQVKVVSSGNVGVGSVTSGTAADVKADLHVQDNSGQATVAVERVDKGNFVNLASGSTGNSFVFKNNKRFGVGPAASLTAQSITPASSLYFYGDLWSVAANAGNMGIGTISPSEKLDVAGTIKALGTNFPSDLRLKKILKNNAKYGLKEVLKLNTVEFEYNGMGGTVKNSRHTGLIAQELQKVAPNLVKEYNHAVYNFIDLPDGDHEQVFDHYEKYLSIKGSEIQFMLINAIQDQQVYISEQDERISDLETKLEQLLELVENNGSRGLDQFNLSQENLASLSQNRPNPFNESTLIDYQIPPNSKNVTLEVYNQLGQLILTEKVQNQSQKGTIELNNSNLTKGTYSYSLKVDNKIVATKKMMIQ